MSRTLPDNLSLVKSAGVRRVGVIFRLLDDPRIISHNPTLVKRTNRTNRTLVMWYSSHRTKGINRTLRIIPHLPRIVKIREILDIKYKRGQIGHGRGDSHSRRKSPVNSQIIKLEQMFDRVDGSQETLRKQPHRSTQQTLRNLSGIFEGTLFNFRRCNMLCLPQKISVISPPYKYGSEQGFCPGKSPL